MRAARRGQLQDPVRRAVWMASLGWLGILVVVSLILLNLPLTGAQQTAPRSVLDEVSQRKVLRAGVRFDNPPHSFINAQGEWVGFDVDIARALARELNVRPQLVRVDELTRISFLKNGRIDVAVASMSHTIKRDMEVDFSITYFWSKQTFIVRKGQATALRDLAGKRVGMSRGSHAIGNWKTWLKRNGLAGEPEIVEFGSKQAGIEAVKQGAIAGYAEDWEILASFAKRDPSLQVLGGEGIGLKQDGVGVRQNDSRMRDAVNFALQRIAQSGEYDRIYNRWFGPRSDTPVPLDQAIEIWPNG